MNADLPPSSAFTPYAAVARAGTTRDTLTLALAPGEVRNPHELMSGSISTNSVSVDGDRCLRAGIAPAQDMALTITF